MKISTKRPETPATPARRRVRALVAMAAVAAASTGVIATSTGTAQAMPRQCAAYASSMRYQWDMASYWTGQYAYDYMAGNWGLLTADRNSEQSAIRGYDSAVALYSANC